MASKNVKQVFDLFAKEYNLATTAEHNPNGIAFYSRSFIKLDYNTVTRTYGLEVVNESSSIRAFDGHNRFTAKEMIIYLRGLLAAKDADNFRGIIL